MRSSSHPSVFAIGDIQGCDCQLDQLVTRATSLDADARFVFAGDLVNRGPDSLSVLRRIRALGKRARIVLGNHDLHLLAVANGIRKSGRSDTVAAILEAPDRDELLDWLRHQPLALMEDDCLIVHAGLPPQWSAQRTLELAAEVEAVLRGPDWIGFLQRMYGNEPARWDEGLQGPDRLRFIVNALTRLRYCHADGSLALEVKEEAQSDSGLLPWFEMPGRASADTTVVFGHWSMLGFMMREKLMCLDSGCIWGGKLTAVRLTDRTVLQVQCPQYQAPG